MPSKKPYGKELIIDLHKCDPNFFNRKCIKAYFRNLCARIDMEPKKLCWWDDLNTPEDEKQTEPHLVGTSAVQFILTSNITIHTLDILRCAYINIFSCKDFDDKHALKFTAEFFDGKIVASHVIDRK